MSALMWCIGGCTVRGRHLDSCQDEECPGCEPRLAEVGRLCRWCFQRLTDAVVDIPALTRHLRLEAAPHLTSPQGREGGGAGVPGSRSLYPPELEAVDELAGLLGSWVDEIVAEHPAHLRGPSTLGWQFSRPDRRVDADTAEAWLPTQERIRADQAAIEEMCRWVLPHLAWVAEQTWAPEMLRELGEQVATARARWPMEERSHRVPMPCPRCRQRSLVYRPPEEYQGVAIVSCESPDCGHMWIGDSWTRLVELVLERPELAEEVDPGASA